MWNYKHPNGDTITVREEMHKTLCEREGFELVEDLEPEENPESEENPEQKKK